MIFRITLTTAAIYAIAIIFVPALSYCQESATNRTNDFNAIDFSRDVRPILSNHCFACHGPDEEHREAGTRLDLPDEADLDAILDRITSDDPDYVMPPPSLNKDLNKTQIDHLKKWIDAGAAYKTHWSFAPPRLPQIPHPENKDWSDQAIDQYVLTRIEQEQLEPKTDAENRTLIRRLSFDLTGLPPSVEEIRQFLKEDATDAQQAYSNLVDRLLDKPQFGEHMARYWLDLVRLADTNGLHHDHFRQTAPFRDWVIRAFNDNLKFDDFVSWQLAGDLYETPTNDQLIASGFNRLHLIIDVGTALPEESLNRNVVDRVTAVGTAFMGLTVQCASCHDHKYDPITQKDFYQLYAFFNNFDGQPETGGRSGLDFQRGLQAPYINLPTPEQKKQLAQLDKELASLDLEIKDLNTELTKIQSQTTPAPETNETGQSTPAADPTVPTSIDDDDDVKIKIDSLLKKLETINSTKTKTQKRRDTIQRTVPGALVMKERKDIRQAHILQRGAYDQPGEVVQRDTPNFLPPMPETTGTKSRLDFAKWLVDPANPLTARVAVNRFWQQLFGVGLVKTSEDFGAQGEPPSHPELLDYLTVNFVESDWNVKQLIRMIVLSKTYRQSSAASSGEFKNDPENRLLARGSRFRLDAEMIRDQVLSVSGLLNPTMYGESVKPPQPDGIWEAVIMPSSYPRKYAVDSGDAIYRRSLYTFWKRAIPPPQMTIFDAPTRESCIARRERTNTPLQALLLMNERQSFQAAIHLANRLIREDEKDDQQKISYAYEVITSQQPDVEVLNRLQEGLDMFRNHFDADVAAAGELLAGAADESIKQISEAEEKIELASWTMIVHSLLNLDITKTRE